MKQISFIISCIVIIIVIVEIINLIYMCIYTRFEKSFVKVKKSGKGKSDDSSGGPLNNKRNIILGFKSILKSLYHFFEAFSYGLMRYNILCVGKIPSFFLRRVLYRFVFCMDITSNTKISGGCEIRSPWNIHADRCIIAKGCILDGRTGITIGQDVVFGQNVHIWTMEHNVDDPFFRVLEDGAKPVVIKDRAWVCSDSTVLPGCLIGEGAVIASRACVVKDCDDYGIYGGVPAKKIKDRNKELKYTLNKRPPWLFY